MFHHVGSGEVERSSTTGLVGDDGHEMEMAQDLFPMFRRRGPSDPWPPNASADVNSAIYGIP